MDKESQNDLSSTARRSFLQKLSLLGATTAMASYSLLELNSNTAEAVATTRRWGLLIDNTKCSAGCDACVRGCHEEHGVRDTGNPHTDAQWIRKIDLTDNQTGRASSLPMMCQHCDSAPCVDVCPTGASFKRADGVVLVNKHTCIGCRYCAMACPYKARSFIHETLSEQKSWAPRGKGTVESCTLCVHRIDAKADLQPACAVACTEEAHSAILFGDLNDPTSDIAKQLASKSAAPVRPDLALRTGVRYTDI